MYIICHSTYEDSLHPFCLERLISSSKATFQWPVAVVLEGQVLPKTPAAESPVVHVTIDSSWCSGRN